MSSNDEDDDDDDDDDDDADSDKYGRSDNDIRHSWPRFVVATL